jgi:hypothetical protein
MFRRSTSNQGAKRKLCDNDSAVLMHEHEETVVREDQTGEGNDEYQDRDIQNEINQEEETSDDNSQKVTKPEEEVEEDNDEDEQEGIDEICQEEKTGDEDSQKVSKPEEEDNGDDEQEGMDMQSEEEAEDSEECDNDNQNEGSSSGSASFFSLSGAGISSSGESIDLNRHSTLDDFVEQLVNFLNTKRNPEEISAFTKEAWFKMKLKFSKDTPDIESLRVFTHEFIKLNVDSFLISDLPTVEHWKLFNYCWLAAGGAGSTIIPLEKRLAALIWAHRKFATRSLILQALGLFQNPLGNVVEEDSCSEDSTSVGRVAHGRVIKGGINYSCESVALNQYSSLDDFVEQLVNFLNTKRNPEEISAFTKEAWFKMKVKFSKDRPDFESLRVFTHGFIKLNVDSFLISDLPTVEHWHLFNVGWLAAHGAGSTLIPSEKDFAALFWGTEKSTCSSILQYVRDFQNPPGTVAEEDNCSEDWTLYGRVIRVSDGNDEFSEVTTTQSH